MEAGQCYRLQKGDFIRTHIDDFIGDIGCIYYENKDWIWDWGGIFHFGLEDPNDDSITAVFPKSNRVVFVNHGKFKFPHFQLRLRRLVKICTECFQFRFNFSTKY